MVLEHAKDFHDLSNAFVCPTLDELLMCLADVFPEQFEVDMFADHLDYSAVIVMPDDGGGLVIFMQCASGIRIGFLVAGECFLAAIFANLR